MEDARNTGKLYLEPICIDWKSKVEEALETKTLTLHIKKKKEYEPVYDPMEDDLRGTIYDKKKIFQDMKPHEMAENIKNDFTDLHKSIINDMRKDSKNNNLDLEVEIKKERMEKSTPERIKQKKANFLDSIKLPDFNASISSQSDYEYDYMSGLWKLIEKETESKDFFISPFGYNVYLHSKDYWLEYPDIASEKIEEAKEKCSKWLEKYYKEM